MATVPTSADIESACKQMTGTFGTLIQQVRRPVFALLGAGELTAQTMADVVQDARAEITARSSADSDTASTPRQVYDYFADRGATTLDRWRGDVDSLLGTASRSARSSGEKTARVAQHAAGQAADTVAESGRQAADDIREAGNSAAFQARSTARKVANRADAAQSQDTSSNGNEDTKPSTRSSR